MKTDPSHMKSESGHILSANRLQDGVVVFMTISGAWSPYIKEAMVAQTQAARALLEERGQTGIERNTIIDPVISAIYYEREGEEGEGERKGEEEGEGKEKKYIRACHLREHIRATGPTIDFPGTYAPPKEFSKTSSVKK